MRSLLPFQLFPVFASTVNILTKAILHRSIALRSLLSGQTSRRINKREFQKAQARRVTNDFCTARVVSRLTVTNAGGHSALLVCKHLCGLAHGLACYCCVEGMSVIGRWGSIFPFSYSSKGRHPSKPLLVIWKIIICIYSTACLSISLTLQCLYLNIYVNYLNISDV